jgi:hypothetical protein
VAEVEVVWTAFTIPFVVVAVVVATGPVYFMAYHSVKYGHVASPSDFAREPAKDPQTFGWTACPECKAIVTDQLEHLIAVHSYSKV